MFYPYMTFSDNTEVTHSKLHEDGTVQVYFEKPMNGGFQHATCILPGYEWENIEGYSKEDIEILTEYVKHNAHLIMEFAAEGGFVNAAAV